MTTNQLKRMLAESADALEEYLKTRHATFPAPRISFTDEPPLMEVAQRLSGGLYVLLPPRGPATAVDCPHCGNPVKVNLSK